MLTWDWKEKIGTATLCHKDKDGSVNSTTLNLYQGNAYLIMIHEFVDNDGQEKYNMVGFFLDKYHMRNCLGLNKKEGYTDNIYQREFEWMSSITINKKKYRYTKDLVTALVESFDNLEIEIVSD